MILAAYAERTKRPLLESECEETPVDVAMQLLDQSTKKNATNRNRHKN